MSDVILKYFPGLSAIQIGQFERIKELYENWNSKINVISRKDMENFYVRHVLHSLAIAKFTGFKEGTKILDAGTGGGFPGIPLAIMFPGANFTLLDSIGKKIKVVSSVAGEISLTNVIPLKERLENVRDKFDFVLCRAVSRFPEFVKNALKNISPGGMNTIGNGIIYLKGGDIASEIAPFGQMVSVTKISGFFSEPFFETKMIIYLAA
jgi:16S rRNA (guanine527-N7)-methyltransferase